MLQGAAKVHPAYAAVFAESYAAADQQYAKLVRREISWGDYATFSVQRYAALRSEVAKTDQQVKAQLDNAHRYEIQQRQAAAAAFSQWAYQQQVIAAMNRPVSTNCTRIGYTVNCTSY